MSLAFLTGALLIPSSLKLRFAISFLWELPHRIRVSTTALHALFGWGLFLLLGALWSTHMRAGWRRRQQKVSGVLLAVCLMTLGLTAWGIYYLGEESTGNLVAVIHMVVGGVLMSFLFIWHWVKGRKIHRANIKVKSKK
jgi:hypothetical protein